MAFFSGIARMFDGLHCHPIARRMAVVGEIAQEGASWAFKTQGNIAIVRGSEQHDVRPAQTEEAFL